MRHLIVIMFIFITACTSQNSEKKIPQWIKGDFVKSALSKQRGQVIRIFCSAKECYYDVRFMNDTIYTNTHLFSQDDPLTKNSFFVIQGMLEKELINEL